MNSPHTVRARNWPRGAGIGLSVLVTLFFLMDAAGKLLQIAPAMEATQALGWPASSVLPLGVLLLVGVALHAVPRTAFLGAIYLTAYLGGAVAAHYRIGSPAATHTLFGVYVALLMWGGLALRYPAVFRSALRPAPA